MSKCFFLKRKQKTQSKKTKNQQTNKQKKIEQVLCEHVEVHALIELQFFILLL